MKYRWAHYIFTPVIHVPNYMDRKRIQCWSNASQHVPIYLQPFLKYSDISVVSDWFSTVNEVNEPFFLPHFAFHWVRPWDNRIKFYMDGKRIQCWSYASQHVPIYLQPFTSYNEILVENCNFFLPLASNAPVWGVPIWIPGKSLDLRKLESWGYQAVKTVWR